MKRWRFSVYNRFVYSFLAVFDEVFSILAKIIGYVDIMLTMCFAQCICFYGCKQDYGAVSGSEYLDVYFLCRLVYLLCRLVYLFCRLADLSCHLLYLFCRLEDLSCRLVYLFCRVVYPWLYLVYFGDILKYGLDPGLNFGLWKKNYSGITLLPPPFKIL